MGQDRITEVEIPLTSGQIQVHPAGMILGTGLRRGKPVLTQRWPEEPSEEWEWVDVVIVEDETFDDTLISLATFYMESGTLHLMAIPGSKFHKWIDGESFVSEDPYYRFDLEVRDSIPAFDAK